MLSFTSMAGSTWLGSLRLAEVIHCLRRGVTGTWSKSSSLLTLLFVMVSSSSLSQAGTITLAWDPSPSLDVTGYRLYRNYTLEADTATLTIQVQVAGTNAVSFYVTAYNAFGESVPSNTVIYRPPGSPPPPGAPPAPIELRVQVISKGVQGFYRVDLVWSSTPDAATEVWQSIKSEPFQQVATVPAGTMHATLNLKRREYTFKVRSVNTSGTSAFSNNVIIYVQ